MKRTISILAAFAVFFLSTAVAFAQDESSVSLDKSVHDFGDIYTDQGPVSCTFTFTNNGSKPILLLSVVASCGCTDVDWTREPIQPAKKGTVKATFDNRGLTQNDDLQLFSEAFYTDEARLLRWKAFMKKIQWKEDLAFADVMRVITKRLEPMYNKYWKK